MPDRIEQQSRHCYKAVTASWQDKVRQSRPACCCLGGPRPSGSYGSAAHGARHCAHQDRDQYGHRSIRILRYYFRHYSRPDAAAHGWLRSKTADGYRYALRDTSASQQSFLEPILSFLSACEDWLGDENTDLPDEANRMLVRLRAFLQYCRRPVLVAEAHSPARCLDEPQARISMKAGPAVLIPEDVQATLDVLAARTTARVRENCELLAVYKSMSEIDRQMDRKSLAHTGL